MPKQSLALVRAYAARNRAHVYYLQAADALADAIGAEHGAGRSYAAIGAELGVSAEAVRRLLARAGARTRSGRIDRVPVRE